MSIDHPLLNGHRFARSVVTLLLRDLPIELSIAGLDYADGASASLHLPVASEHRLLGLLGKDPFKASFDINVAFSASMTGPLVQDRLIDCRVQGTGYDPMPLSVLSVKRGARPGPHDPRRS